MLHDVNYYLLYSVELRADCLVREEGLEPSILAAADFKSAVYTIPPLSHFFLVLPPGIEPGSTVLQTAAMTTSAKVALVPAEGIEPSQER